jgi:hypothetical protein
MASGERDDVQRNYTCFIRRGEDERLHGGFLSVRECCLACAEALLEDAFATLNALVFDKLDSIVRASSLVEMVPL